MFIVTFHGGSGGTNCLYSYTDSGSGCTPYLTAATPAGTNGFRDVQFLPQNTDGQFFLVNSYKDASEIFQIESNATTMPAPFVNGEGGKGTVLCSVYHPFALAFDGEMEVCYISNQDTNVVVRVNGPQAANPGQPMAINPSLEKLFTNPTFLPGTFVASQVPLAPPGCPTPTAVTSEQGGLAASPSGLSVHKTPSNSVRGLAVIDTTLYVADEVNNFVRLYDTGTGEYLGNIADSQKLIVSPTHLLSYDGLLYISVKSSTSAALVLCYNPSTPSLSVQVSNSKDLNIQHPSGMTFDGTGNFYLADLTGQVVYQFDPKFNLGANQPFIPQGGGKMPDQPEFILWVNDDWLGSGTKSDIT